MGNRAVITIKKDGVLNNFDKNEIGVYLHWNGGYDSVSAFLKYCELKEYISPEKDYNSWTKLRNVIENYFEGESNVVIDKCENLYCNNFDNGVYLIKDWKIVGRVYYDDEEQDSYDMLEMLLYINEKQPKEEQLTEDFINMNFKEN